MIPNITQYGFLLTIIPLIVISIISFIVHKIIKMNVFRNISYWCILSIVSQTILIKLIPLGPFEKYTNFIYLLSVIILPSLILSFILRQNKHLIFWGLTSLFLLIIDAFLVHTNVSAGMTATVINICAVLIVLAILANYIKQRLLQIIGIEISLLLILLITGLLVFYTFDFFWGQNLVLENENINLDELTYNLKLGEVKFKSLIKKPDSLDKIYFCLQGEENIIIEKQTPNNNEFRESLEILNPFENISEDYDKLIISEKNDCSTETSLGYLNIIS